MQDPKRPDDQPQGNDDNNQRRDPEALTNPTFQEAYDAQRAASRDEDSSLAGTQLHLQAAQQEEEEQKESTLGKNFDEEQEKDKQSASTDPNSLPHRGWGLAHAESEKARYDEKNAQEVESAQARDAEWAKQGEAEQSYLNHLREGSSDIPHEKDAWDQKTKELQGEVQKEDKEADRARVQATPEALKQDQDRLGERFNELSGQENKQDPQANIREAIEKPETQVQADDIKKEHEALEAQAQQQTQTDSFTDSQHRRQTNSM